MSGRVPCGKSDRPAQSPAEERYSWALQRVRAQCKLLAECAMGLKMARQAFDSAIAQHGPVSSITDHAHRHLLKQREELRLATLQLSQDEQLQDAAYRAWASEVAGQQYQQQHRNPAPRLGGPASYDGQGSPPQAGPPPWRDSEP